MWFIMAPNAIVCYLKDQLKYVKDMAIKKQSNANSKEAYDRPSVVDRFPNRKIESYDVYMYNPLYKGFSMTGHNMLLFPQPSIPASKNEIIIIITLNNMARHSYLLNNILKSGIQQGSSWGPLLFNVYLNDVDFSRSCWIADRGFVM